MVVKIYGVGGEVGRYDRELVDAVTSALARQDSTVLMEKTIATSV